MDLFGKRLHWLGAGLVFLITQVVYLKTMTITCPFWDSGEFIATSYIMGIPHPPGTPLYVVIGRLFSMLPFFHLVAARVNYLSALGGSLGAVFMYLFTVELWRRWSWPRMRPAGSPGTGLEAAGGPAAGLGLPGAGNGTGAGGEEGWQRYAGFFAGLVAALFVAFSPTYWDNSIEAEVYSLAALIMAMSGWLILRWSRATESSQGKTGLFLLLYYLICLSMGIALSAFLILPGIILFALLEDRRFFGDSFLGAVLVAGITLLLHPGMLPTLGLHIYGPLFVLVLLSVLFLGRKWAILSGRGLLTWCLIVSVLGLSTHFYLTIRALYHNPAINEADPQTWDALWKVLTRDQYQPPNPFLVRKAPWSVQFGKHFWEYSKGQYSLGLRPVWLGNYLPYLLGLVGAAFQARRDRRGFAFLGASYLIMTVGLVFYLNFATDEVRDRDYFFAAAYQFFAVWIGLGVGALLGVLRQGEGGRRAGIRITVLAGVVGALLPFMTMRRYWYEHDRSRFWVARDFAYNMLTPLKPNAILFTNGDNDTFPLWYLQEVEHIRKDVRVACLSLLNTHWYIRQLRDFPPKVDFDWSDQDIDGLEAYLDSKTQQPVWIKDMAVQRIVEREYGKRPIYVAVTVPELMGLDDRLVMEGMAFELKDPVPGATDRVDTEMTLHNLRSVYLYRGLLRPDGTFDRSVYKDENATRLLQNYSAGYLRAAEDLLDRGDERSAMEAANAAKEISPDSRSIRYAVGILLMRARRYSEAESYFQSLLDQGADDPHLFMLLARSQEAQQKMADAETNYRRALAAQPADFETMRDLFSFLWESKGKRTQALEVLRDWVRRHPDDSRVAAALKEYSDSLAGGSGGEQP